MKYLLKLIAWFHISLNVWTTSLNYWTCFSASSLLLALLFIAILQFGNFMQILLNKLSAINDSCRAQSLATCFCCMERWMLCVVLLEIVVLLHLSLKTRSHLGSTSAYSILSCFALMFYTNIFIFIIIFYLLLSSTDKKTIDSLVVSKVGMM